MWKVNVRNRIIEIESTDDPALSGEKEQLYAELRRDCAHETVLETIVDETEEEPQTSRICTICALEERGCIDKLGVEQGFNKLIKSLPILRMIHRVRSEDFERYKKLKTSTVYVSRKVVPVQAVRVMSS